MSTIHLRRSLSFHEYHEFKRSHPSESGFKEDPGTRPLSHINQDIDRYLTHTRSQPSDIGAEKETVEKGLTQMLGDIELELGERWLGETTTTIHQIKLFYVHRPSNTIPNPEFDSYDQLGQYADDYVRDILATASDGPDGKAPQEARTMYRALLLLKLWSSCESLWDRSLCYRTLNAVCDGVRQYERVVEADNKLSQSLNRSPSSAFAAAAVMVRVTRQDSAVFKEINRGDAKWSVLGVLRAALEELGKAEQLLSDALRDAGADTNDSSVPPTLRDEVVELLHAAQAHCEAQRRFYRAIERATLCLQQFEAWMGNAPRFGSADPIPDPLRPDHFSAIVSEVSKGLSDLDAMMNDASTKEVGGDATVASRFEPWRQLLLDINATLEACRKASPLGASVFVPKQVSVLYCFPFAVDYSQGKHRQVDVEDHIRTLDPDLVPHRAGLGMQKEQTPWKAADVKGVLPTRLMQELVPLFEPPAQVDEMGTAAVSATAPSAVLEVMPLAVSAFWLGSGYGLYGGKRVQLPDVTIGDSPHHVWLVISRIGNHSLCVEPEHPMSAASTDWGALPSDLYRALRLATPWAIGEEVRLSSSGHQGASWDNMHMFAHDVVLATARALTGDVVGKIPKRSPGTELPPYMPGNLHEVITVQTDEPITMGVDDAARRLDDVVGAQLLFTSANRVAGTLAEWLRDPSPSATYQASQEVDSWSGGTITPLPLIGFKGDWFVHTGATTVFGTVAVPSWLKQAYIDVAQFAASWVPLLELWTVRLQEVIRTAHADHRGVDSSEQLRIVDQAIRRQTSELRSPQLCQSQLHRRFLDIFLSESGVTNLERELDAQLVSAERLADWYDERRRRRAEDARNILLLVIGLFGVFGLASYLSLANGTSGERRYTGLFRFLNLNPQIEVHIVLGVFALFLGSGLFLLREQVFGVWRFVTRWPREHAARRLRRQTSKESRKRRRPKSNQPDS